MKRILWILFWLSLADCTTSAVQLDRVEPATVSSLAPTPVVMVGGTFATKVSYDVDDDRMATLSSALTVQLGSQLLDAGAVVRVDDQHLAVTVPAGFSPGMYDVTVTAPHGIAAKVAALRVEVPPLLTATATTPTKTSVGQTFDLTLTVRNDGEATAFAVTPDVPQLGGQGAATLLSSPAAADIPGGGATDFHWSYAADSAGSVTLNAGATGHDSSGAVVTAKPQSATIEIDTAPVLQASATLSPTHVSVGQNFTLSLRVTNSGQSAASAVVPAAPITTGTAAAQLLSAQTAPADLQSGASVTWSWSYRATTPGTASFDLAASGTAPSKATVRAQTTAGPLTVDAGPMLTATLVATPALATTGQAITLTMTLTNSGGVAALSVAPSTPSLVGTGGASLASIPGSVDVPAGGTVSVVWHYTANIGGNLHFTAAATGTDGNSGVPVSAPLATSNTITIQSAAAISASITAAPSTVSVNQLFVVDVTVTNNGDTDANAVSTSTPTQSGGGVATMILAGPTQTVPGRSARTFTWTYKATAAGAVTFKSRGSGTAAGTGLVITTATVSSNTVTIQTAPSLSMAIAASSTSTYVGQLVTITVTVTNGGQAAARNVVPAITLSGDGGIAPSSGPSPASTTLAAGASQSFVWTYLATARGDEKLTATATAVDANSGAAVGSLSANVTVKIIQPNIIATLTAPASAAPFATFNVVMTVKCVDPDNLCFKIAPSSLSQAGTTTATLVSGPSPASVYGPTYTGNSVTFTWVYRAGTTGTSVFSGYAQDVDNGVTTNYTGTVSSNLVVVGSPAQLSGVLALPAILNRGTSFTATLTVTNSAAAAVTALTPSALTQTGATVTLQTGPTPASATVAASGTQTFTWIYLANQDGAVTLAGTVTGTDSGSGLPTSTSFSSSSLTTDASLMFSNPFNDGTSFLDIVAYNGRIYLGPRKNGSGALRANPDGTIPESVNFSFPADRTGHQGTNKSTAPYPSLGTTGCTANSASCGQDNEDGRGLFTTGTIAGTPWFLVAGTKSTGTSYLYMSSDTSTTMVFPYVDFNTPAKGNPFGVTATHVFHDRILVGFGATSGPLILQLSATPAAPGLDASSTDTTDLKLAPLAGNGAIVDVVTDYADRLYLANANACLASTSNTPRPYDTNPADWTSCTPATDPLTLNATAKTAALEPADRAYPAAVTFGGRLYLARNTAVGPQLFRCDPTLTGDASVCDPADFVLVARNSQGNTALTQLDDPSNSAITLLVATATHLYVGFNSATGIQVFRSTSSTPLDRADFEGLGGCSAALHPSNCAALGGSGLGDPSNTRIYSATAAAAAGLYLTTGNGSVGGRVYRIAE